MTKNRDWNSPLLHFVLHDSILKEPSRIGSMTALFFNFYIGEPL